MFHITSTMSVVDDDAMEAEAGGGPQSSLQCRQFRRRTRAHFDRLMVTSFNGDVPQAIDDGAVDNTLGFKSAN